MIFQHHPKNIGIILKIVRHSLDIFLIYITFHKICRMNDFSIQFKDRCAEEMKRSGFLRATVAEKIRVSKSKISRYSDGSMGSNTSSIAKLSLLFCCNTDYLLALTLERNSFGEP